MVRKPLPEEALMALRQQFELRSTTRAERKHLVQETAAVYGVSTATVYRALRTQARARPLRRTDYGVPRVMAPAELERYYELIVERPFRTVKEVHETLYHFHTPQHEEEANTWLLNFLLRYNEQPHRTEPHSRLEDWLANLPPAGIRQMCSWERFCTFAREPERRTVGLDAQVSVHGTRYPVDEELVGQTVVLWWGLFDDELFVECEGRKYGPYRPVGGLIPFDRYRAFRKTPAERRAERVEAIAVSLALPREALTTDPRAPEVLRRQLPQDVPLLAFRDPDPFDELTFPSVPAAKRAIAALLGMPLAKLSPGERETIDGIVRRTLVKAEVMTAVRAFSDGAPVSPLAEGDTHGDLA